MTKACGVKEEMCLGPLQHSDVVLCGGGMLAPEGQALQGSSRIIHIQGTLARYNL